MTLKWYYPDGRLRSEQNYPMDVDPATVYTSARRKSRNGFTTVIKHGKIRWYKGGKWIKLPAFHQK